MTHTQLKQIFPQQNFESDFRFSGVSIDNRKVQPGNLFVAIKGDRFDGHEFANDVHNKGAVAMIVERNIASHLPQIIVKDTRQALALLANAWRKELNPQVIAITGSNGKTTVKEMLGRILSAQRDTLMTQGNFNNDIGVPLTLFRLSPNHYFAVIEMGANHAHEIDMLSSIADPNVVYVNNAQEAHVEGFGSLQGVIKAKGEMYQYCSPEALAVFNEDEPATDYWKSISTASRQLGFSLSKAADIVGQYEPLEQGILLTVNQGEKKCQSQISVYGQHNAQNALAAISLALACGVTLEQACSSLDGFSGVAGRQQFIQGIGGSCLIDDSYNANPDSLAAAVNVLCGLKGEPWLALGDMAELGEQSQQLHQQAVKGALGSGVEQFFALGEMSCHAAKQFGEQGFCFTQHDEMADFLAGRLKLGVNLLIKGSRSAGMDKLVQALSIDSSINQSVLGTTAGENHAL